jgi:hypothetical protein
MIHDWTRVEAGIFHDFHHAWIEEIKRALNSGLLPDEYYALAEQYAGGVGPDVLTLQSLRNGNGADYPTAIWDEIAGMPYSLPAEKPLTLASYETAETVKAYVEHVAVGDPLPDMPLFLAPGAHVPLPLESTYQSAWNAVPRRWRSILERK